MNYLESELSERDFRSFVRWMAYQTMMICDGRLYNHETREYYPSPCTNDPHGVIAYAWDFDRWANRPR